MVRRNAAANCPRACAGVSSAARGCVDTHGLSPKESATNLIITIRFVKRTTMRRLQPVLWVLPSVALFALTAAGQDTNQTVGEVRFEGAVGTTEAYMLSVIRTRAGDPYAPETLDADVSRLLRTGRFLDVTYRVDDADRGVDVTFVVHERPVIATIRFEGNRLLSDSALLEHVPAKPGDPVDAYAVREGRDNILSAYRDRGYGHTTVEIDQEKARTTGELVYRIEEGPKVRVREVFFEGNVAIDEPELRKLVQTKPAMWIFRAGAYDPDVVAADAVEVQNHYRQEGYLDARVSYRVEPGAEPGDLNVVFAIVEGRPYRVETIRVEGNTVMTDEELLGIMASGTQQIVKLRRLDADVRTVQTRYGERGYIYASVRAIRVFSTTPGYVIITVQITEGEKISVGRIVVRGNEGTQDKVVRRALELFPGDTFNLTLATQAEQRLRQSQIFDDVSVTPVGTLAGVRDILIDVSEAESTNDFVFGFGITSNSGLVGSILLDIRNFDIFDTPRSFGEFIRMRAFRGAGQRLRLELQPGTELNRFRIDFTEPYLFDQPLRFDFSVYHFTRNREGYDEQRTGSNVSFGRRLDRGVGSRGWFKDWYAEIAFRAEQVELDDIDIFDDRSVRDVEGGTFLTSAKMTLVRDTTDSRFAPTRGDRMTLSYEQFIGDFVFGKLRLRWTRHTTVSVDELDRKSVFSLRADAGFIGGDAPVFEKFYAGGIGSIRGFDFRGIGPRGGLKNDPIGGDFLLTGTAEYSFPLTGELLRGVLFTDVGTVEEDFGLSQLRMSVGFGVRMTVQMFGPVPIELDFAIPVLADDDDDERVFNFFIGGTF